MKRIGLILLVTVFLSSGPLGAEEAKSVDEALLEDLGSELLEPQAKEPGSLLDERLIEQLSEQVGEDLGQGRSAQDNPLSQVVRHMQAAQALLEETTAPVGASSAQADALSNLDSLLAQLTERKNKCCGGNCSKPSKPGDKKPGSAKKAGKSPAESAPANTNSDADLTIEVAVASELVKDLWGQLPERQREQILQPLSEEFLPKYADEIEAYFRDLADPDRTRVDSP